MREASDVMVRIKNGLFLHEFWYAYLFSSIPKMIMGASYETDLDSGVAKTIYALSPSNGCPIQIRKESSTLCPSAIRQLITLLSILGQSIEVPQRQT